MFVKDITVRVKPVRLLVACAILLPLAAACGKKSLDVQGGVLTALTGTLTVRSASGIVSKVGSEALNTKAAILGPGTVIEVSQPGQADIAFTSGVLLRVAGGGKLTITSARVLADQNFTQTQLRLDHGKLFVRSPKLGKTSRLAVVTPTAVAAVRGTDFLVKTEKGKTSTLVGEGSVEVSDDQISELKPVEAGQKADVDAKGAVDVQPQTEEDKQELNNMSQGVQGITEQGRAQIQSILETFEEQKKLIRQALDEQKRSNEALLQAQKDKDQNLVKDQKAKDREMLQEQIRRDRELMDQVRSEAKRNVDEVQDKTKAEASQVKEKTRQDMDTIKSKTGTGEIDKTRSEMEKLKKMQ